MFLHYHIMQDGIVYLNSESMGVYTRISPFVSVWTPVSQSFCSFDLVLLKLNTLPYDHDNMWTWDFQYCRIDITSVISPSFGNNKNSTNFNIVYTLASLVVKKDFCLTM